MRKSTQKWQRMDPHERLVKMMIKANCKSSFTKKLTPNRRKNLIGAFGELSQADLAVVKRKGWDKGILKLSSEGKLRW